MGIIVSHFLLVGQMPEGLMCGANPCKCWTVTGMNGGGEMKKKKKKKKTIALCNRAQHVVAKNEEHAGTEVVP